MTNFIKFLSLILIFIVTFSSCTKEELVLPDNTNYVEGSTYSPEGVQWILAEAIVYVDNLSNPNDNRVYSHFGGSRTSSCMNIFGPAPVLMDSIRQNLTTWYFQNGTFTLDGVSQFQYTVANDRVWSPIGLSGGTSRPIEVINVTATTMSVKVHEAYGSDGAYNYKFWSILTFIKAGETCNGCSPDVTQGYFYSGILTPLGIPTSTLNGTKWVVSRYNNGLSGNVYPNDTLDFISNTQYTINGGSVRNYSVSNVIGNNNKSLSLYSFTTLGGDYSGQVIGTFIDDWVINNTQMVDMFNVNNTVTVWIDRLQ
jgi:hypothetical protein